MSHTGLELKRKLVCGSLCVSLIKPNQNCFYAARTQQPRGGKTHSQRERAAERRQAHRGEQQRGGKHTAERRQAHIREAASTQRRAAERHTEKLGSAAAAVAILITHDRAAAALGAYPHHAFINTRPSRHTSGGVGTSVGGAARATAGAAATRASRSSVPDLAAATDSPSDTDSPSVNTQPNHPSEGTGGAGTPTASEGTPTD